jgi:hypothetical protein
LSTNTLTFLVVSSVVATSVVATWVLPIQVDQ